MRGQIVDLRLEDRLELETVAPIPWWVRAVLVGFALLFGLMVLWLLGLTDDRGAGAVIMAVFPALVAIRLLVAAVRGTWTWTLSWRNLFRV